MRGNHDSGQLRRGPRVIIAMTERELRKNHALADGDRIIEWKQGRIEAWSVAGTHQPLPRAFVKLDISPLRGLSSCSYSARRLYFGSNARLFADLEAVWHASSDGAVLRVVFSSPRLTAIRWRSDEAEDAAALASFAERIMAQRDSRLAEVPADARQRAAECLTELKLSGRLAAALAEPETP